MAFDVVLPPPVRPGDRVAVVSPSWCGPEQFPAIHEQALRWIRAGDPGRRVRAAVGAAAGELA